MIPRGSVALNGALFALLAWLYGGDLYDAMRAETAEVAALNGLPSVPFAGALVALALLGGALTVFGVSKKRDGTWRGYRVMPIIAVVGLFVDLLVVSADKAPFPPAWRASAAVELFQNKASQLGTEAAVSTDVAALEGLLGELGPPPWLVKGKPIAKWTLKVETRCTGPRLEAQGEPAGTIFYCVAADRAQAWITLVGLPREERFGPPQLFAAGGAPVVGVVQRKSAPAAPEGAAAEGQTPELKGRAEGSTAPEMLPMYFDADAGNLAPAP